MQQRSLPRHRAVNARSPTEGVVTVDAIVKYDDRGLPVEASCIASKASSSAAESPDASRLPASW